MKPINIFLHNYLCIINEVFLLSWNGVSWVNTNDLFQYTVFIALKTIWGQFALPKIVVLNLSIKFALLTAYHWHTIKISVLSAPLSFIFLNVKCFSGSLKCSITWWNRAWTPEPEGWIFKLIQSLLLAGWVTSSWLGCEIGKVLVLMSQACYEN